MFRSLWEKINVITISERYLLVFIVFISGVSLLFAGAAGGIKTSSFSMPIPDLYLKIVVIIVGGLLIIISTCSALRENKCGKKIQGDMAKLMTKMSLIEEKIKLSDDGEQEKWRASIENMITQRLNDDVALSVLRKQLNSDIKPSKPEIDQVFRSASPLVRNQIFFLVKQCRENMVLNY